MRRGARIVPPAARPTSCPPVDDPVPVGEQRGADSSGPAGAPREDQEVRAPAFASRPAWSATIVALTLALIALWIFLPALENGFVNFDDGLYVTDSPWLHEGLSLRSATWAFGQFYASNWHPLTVLSHMLDQELFGLDPRGHHLTSVILHAVNCALLFALLRAATGAVWRSAFAALLFALHPLRVESVAWVSERKDVLSALFALLALAAYVRWTREPSSRNYLATVCCFAFSLMSKATVITLPLVLLLLDFWPLRRVDPLERPIPWRRWATLGLEKVPLLVLALAVGLLTILAQGDAMSASAPTPLSLRAANAIDSYVSYLRMTLLPTGLSVFYPFPAAISPWRVVASLSGLALVTAGALLSLRRAPYLAVGWLWFLGSLAPVIGLLKVGDQAMADRYTYLPSIGLAIAASWGWAALTGGRLRRVSVALATALLVLLALLAGQQIRVWHDSVTLFRQALRVTTGNHIAHINLAQALAERGERSEAIHHYRRALEIREDSAVALGGLAQLLLAEGDAAASERHLLRALAIAPCDHRLHIALASTREAMGRLAEARASLAAALACEPLAVGAHWGLSRLFAREGELARAIAHARAGLSIEPNRTELRLFLVELLVREGRLEEARIELAAVPGGSQSSAAEPP